LNFLYFFIENKKIQLIKLLKKNNVTYRKVGFKRKNALIFFKNSKLIVGRTPLNYYIPKNM